MANGKMINGKFHPFDNESTNDVSSDQVENQDVEPQMNSKDVEKLKKRD